MRPFKPEKDYKCKVCKGAYKKAKPLQLVCSPKCAIVHAKRLEDKRQKEEKREYLRQWRHKKELLAEEIGAKKDPNTIQHLQRKINLLCRLIDKGHPCISNDRQYKSHLWDAGHFFPVGSHGWLRFNLLNIWKQNKFDNNDGKGNIVGYRSNLIRLYGKDFINELDALEWQYQDIKLMKHEIEAKISIVKELIKELNKALETKEKFTTIERLEMRRLFNKIIGIYE